MSSAEFGCQHGIEIVVVSDSILLNESATVVEHLEHMYPKPGVENRTGASFATEKAES